MNPHTAAVETDKEENPFSLSDCLQSHKPVSNWDQWKLRPFILFYFIFVFPSAGVAQLGSNFLSDAVC